MPVVYPIHPRSQKKIEEFGLSTDDIAVVGPQDLFAFLQFEQHAKLVLTDSGGVQEETCILGNPCVTLRDNTERPETLELGSNILACTESENIVNCVSVMLKKINDSKKPWINPFGNGASGKQIVRILKKYEK